jgi:hypothetical protein
LRLGGLFLLLFYFSPVRAQTDVPYTTMQQPAGASAPAAAPVVDPDPLAAPAAAPSGGHTAITAQMAKAYYTNCAGKGDPHITPAGMKAMCSCTSDQMVKTMSVEDIKTLAQNDQAGRDMLNHMLLDVYAPCMNFPVQDMLEGQCLQDMKDKPLPPGADMGKICHCMAAKTGGWFTTNGRSLMAQVLKANPDITDPVGPVMEDASFKKASSDNLSSCLSGADAP